MLNNLQKTYSICLNKEILTSEVQKFIINYSEDISKLAFAGSPFNEVSTQELIQQIESRRKIEKKLSTWFQKQGIYYPPKLNLEQTSSELTAKYKASLIKGNIVADTTGGFGVDSFYFSEYFKTVHHFEINKCLSKIAEYNFSVFNKTNIHCILENGISKIENQQYDVIYSDPSRRNDKKGKVFFLKDCEPNIPENINHLLNHCKQLLIKSSPMLDISIGLIELKNVSEIHIVAVNNEVKELLWLITPGFTKNPIIKTINFKKNNKEVFNFEWQQKAVVNYSDPKGYLYEPNAAIMKSGAFTVISEKYSLHKLHKHTHLYTSDKLIDFPGRRFKINEVIPYQKKALKTKLHFNKANITTRNFPESVSNIRKKLKINDGGTNYLFFTTLENNKRSILVCSKV